MKEDSIDEFEAVFERASIPVLEIKPITFRNVGLVLRDHALDNSALDIGRYLRHRFGPTVHVFYPDNMDQDSARKNAQAHDLTLVENPFKSETDLVGQVAVSSHDLLIVPDTQDAASGDINIDVIVEATSPPVLILREPVNNPEYAFSNLLHVLTGNFQQSENFSCSFSLVEGKGEILLLHVIEPTELHEIGEALNAAPHATERARTELLEEWSHHGERFLKGVVAAQREKIPGVKYRLEMGEVEKVVTAQLQAGRHGLLVVGHHKDGRSYVDAADYALMHKIKNVPVIAL